MSDLHKKFQKNIDLFGQNRKITIDIYLEWDDEAHNIVDDSDCYTEKERQKLHDDLNKFRLNCFIIEVKVFCDLFKGSDSLDGSFIKEEKEIDEVIKDYDLINQAIDEYKQDYKRYLDFFKGVSHE